jgi:lysophospholipase L1-like esterase
MLSDAVQFITYGNNSTNTFDVDLEKGLYKITVYLGNTMRTSIAAEGVLQLINMTGNNAVDSFVIPVTDGQLNILATAGKVGYAYTISAMEIEKIADDATNPKTIWICGDSTVCNYYPLAASVQAGWGQVLNNYVSSSFQIRNMASGGQYAKGFVDAGQFDPILKYGKAGDYYIISIGINDINYSNSTEYYSVVTEMTKKAKDLGMTVILVKQQGRSNDIAKAPLLTGRWFGTTLDTVGTEQNVQVVDLFNLAQDYFVSIGQEATTALYMSGDTLHPNRDGANILARLFASVVTIQ